jgi:asparagine synthase (glutamine-hydrolysing)
MCGILLAISKTGRLDQAACRRALSTMSWRGPDFALSRVWEDRLFLGQTVLSITGDPAEGQGEYHRSRSGRYELVYNGEIYNCGDLQNRFLQSRDDLQPRFGTDTEVLVNLHEVLPPAEVPPLLDGMYAYVLFDGKERQIHLMRDVQGEKSLYLYEDDRWFVAASEIRAIRALVPGITLDRQALRDYFRTRHLMLFNRTVYGRIRELPPGCLATLNLDGLGWSERRLPGWREWIEPQRMLDNQGRTLDQLADELDGLLAGCVREMLPQGRRYAAVVSGGVDSSLIARYVVAQGDPALLVAVNHVGKDHISDDLAGFEKALNRPVATLRVDAAAYAAEIGRCQQDCGSPLPTHAFVPQSQQSAFVRNAGCRVLFGGDGADELFGGYEAYLTQGLSGGPYSPSPYTAHLTPNVTFRTDAPAPFQAALASAWKDALEAYAFVEDRRARERLAMMYCDGVHQLPAVGLRGADLMSMMWSVETRSVYLRKPIVQFALNLPAAMKTDVDAKTTAVLRAKPLLKRLFLRHYPASLLKEKQGFTGFPNEAAAWLGHPADYRVLSELDIDPASLEAAWSDRSTAWKLINLEYFFRYGSS